MRSNAKAIFKKLEGNLTGTIKAMRKEMGEISVQHFKHSFYREGFNNTPFMHWKLLKRPRPYPYNKKKILNRTGRLKNSLRYRTKATGKDFQVRVFTDVPYAIYHNEGTDRLPRRRFIGYSKVLEKKLAARVAFRLRKFK